MDLCSVPLEPVDKGVPQRRLIIHESVYEEVKNKLSSAYKQLKIGNPLDEKNHVGPLIDKDR